MQEKRLLNISDYALSPTELFPDAVNKSMVLVVENSEPEGEVSVAMSNREGEMLEWSIDPIELPLDRDAPRSPWMIAPPEVVDILREMEHAGPKMGNIYTPTRGVQTAANELYIVNSVDPTDSDEEIVVETDAGEIVRIEKALIRPLLRGRTVDEWSYEIDNFLIYTHGEDAEVLESLPAKATEYFESHRDRLEGRRDFMVRSPMEDGAPYWIIGNVKPDEYREKVAWQDVAKTIESAYLPSTVDYETESGVDFGETDLITTSTVYYFSIDDVDAAKALAGTMNSTPARVYAGTYALRTGGNYCKHKGWTLGLVPLPEEILSGDSETASLAETLHDNVDPDLIDQLDDRVTELYGISDSESEALDEFLEFFLN